MGKRPRSELLQRVAIQRAQAEKERVDSNEGARAFANRDPAEMMDSDGVPGGMCKSRPGGDAGDGGLGGLCASDLAPSVTNYALNSSTDAESACNWAWDATQYGA
jgi:hypothetical protein